MRKRNRNTNELVRGALSQGAKRIVGIFGMSGARINRAEARIETAMPNEVAGARVRLRDWVSLGRAVLGSFFRGLPTVLRVLLFLVCTALGKHNE